MAYFSSWGSFAQPEDTGLCSGLARVRVAAARPIPSEAIGVTGRGGNFVGA
jgi:hypothetical protein